MKKLDIKKKRNKLALMLVIFSGIILIVLLFMNIYKNTNIKRSLEFLNAGKEAFNNKEYGNAIKNFKISIKFNPNNYEAYNFLASSYLMIGQNEQAIKYYRKSISLNPKNSETYRLLGNAYFYINEYELAKGQFKKALEHDPNDFLALNGVGLSYLNLGNYEKSLLYYNQSLKVRYNEPAIEGLGKVYYWLEDYDKAYFYLNKSYNFNTNNGIVVSYLLSSYNTVGMYDEAIGLAKESLKRESNNSHHYRKIGIAHFFKGNNEEALINLKKAVELEPSAATNQLSISIVYLSLRDTANADKHLQEAIELSKESTAYEALSVYFLLIGNKEEAENNHQLAIKYSPHSFGFSMTGFALLNLGYYNRAIEDFNLSIQKTPDYYLPYKGLGKVYMALGQKEKAVENFGKAVELNDFDEESKRLLEETKK